MANVPWFLDPMLLPAATGFIGVVVGGLITAGSSYLLDERREKRQRVRETELRAIELRRAARLIQAELVSGMAAVNQTKKDGEYYCLPSDTLETSSWATEKVVLAPSLTFLGWNQVVLAYSSLANFKAQRDRAIAAGIEESARNDTKHLESVLVDLKEGLGSIQHLL